jgi:Protein of unknown function (DUF3054)
MRTSIRIALDLVLVLVFAIIGRASHGEALTPGGILLTGWPFLVGCLLASVLACVVLRLSWLREGLLVWAITGGSLAIGFLIVATIVLAVFLIGWRMVAWRITVARPDSGSSDPVPTR